VDVAAATRCWTTSRDQVLPDAHAGAQTARPRRMLAAPWRSPPPATTRSSNADMESGSGSGAGSSKPKAAGSCPPLRSSQWYTVVRQIRDKLLAIPAKLAPQLAALSDPAEIRDLLDAEIIAILKSLQEEIRYQRR